MFLAILDFPAQFYSILGYFLKNPKNAKIAQNSDKYNIFVFLTLTKSVKRNKIKISLLVPCKTITKEELCPIFTYSDSYSWLQGYFKISLKTEKFAKIVKNHKNTKN